MTSIWAVTDGVPQVLKNTIRSVTANGYQANQAAGASLAGQSQSQSVKTHPKTSRSQKQQREQETVDVGGCRSAAFLGGTSGPQNSFGLSFNDDHDNVKMMVGKMLKSPENTEQRSRFLSFGDSKRNIWQKLRLTA